MKRAFILLVVLAIIGGGVGVFGKIALREIPPFSFTALRFMLTVLVLAIWRRHDARPRQSYPLAAYLVPLLLTGNIVLFAFGIQLTGATTSQIMYASSPLLVAGLSWHFLRQRMSIITAVGILIGLVGVLVALIPGGKETTVSALGPLLVGCAVVSFSFYLVFSKKYTHAVAPRDLVFIFSWMTAFIAAVLAISDLWRHPQWWSQLSAGALWSLLFVGIVGTALYYILQQIMIQRASPTIASMTLILQPFTAFFWASLFLDERMTLPLFAGMILTILGAWLVTQQRAPSSP